MTEQLRAHEGGRLKRQEIDGEEYPPYLYDGDASSRVRPRSRVVRAEQITPEQRRQLFAIGSDTGEPRRSAS